MRKKIIAMLCLSVLFFAACQKENGNYRLRLLVETPTSQEKVYVDNQRWAWFNLGDQIRVNGYSFRMAAPKTNSTPPTYFVDVDEDMISRQPNYYDIFYPGVGSTYDATSRTYSVELNATQPYVEDGDGNQKIACVMAGTAAASEGSVDVQMHNLTALLKVNINLPSGQDYVLKSITVRAKDNSGNEKCFAGKYTVNLAAATPAMTLVTSPMEGAQQVVLTVPETDGAISGGSSKSFYVAVPPMQNVKFSVMLYGKLTSSGKTTKVIATKRQTNWATLNANEVGTINFTSVAEGEGQLPYLYTVAADANGNPTKKVRFSIGNLQYKRGGTHSHKYKSGSINGTWRFAENQYDYIGADNNKITQLANNTNTTDWIDLFGWATNQNQWSGTEYQPYSSSDAHQKYGCNGNFDQNDRMPKAYDWAANEISNGGGVDAMNEEKWETMSIPEWSYVVSGTATVGGLSTDPQNARYQCNSLATVCGVKGVIILPDYSWSKGWNKYVNPISCAPFVPNAWGNFNANVYNQDQWDEMEAAGAVFFPAAGQRRITTVSGYSNASSGAGLVYVWTSSGAFTSYGNSAGLFKYDPSTQFFGVPRDTQNRSFGGSVRLVHVVPSNQW